MLTTWQFRVLEVSVALTGPRDVLTPVARAYRRFLVGGHPRAGTHEIRLEAVDAESFKDGPNTVPVIRRANLTLQVYERFLNAIFDRVSGYAVLHAAALVDSAGGALVIAGPTGFGKTSLTLELLRRGCGFLSDDYAPIDLSTGEVHPYPRTVGLLREGSARTPECFVDAAADPAVPRLLGKSLIDVGEVLGEGVIAKKPVPLNHVVILDSGGPCAAVYRSVVSLGIWPQGVDDAEALVGEMPGVVVRERQDRDDISIWRVELRHDKLPTERFSDFLERDFVAFSETRPSAGPDFASEPRLTPLKRREAALSLCREVQNRRSRGRLMQAYGGDTMALYVELASCLASAQCWKLELGSFESTANRLEELAGKLRSDSART